MGERLIQEAVEHLRAARVPEYRFPERAAAALEALVERVALLKYASAEPLQRQDVQTEKVRQLIAQNATGNHLSAPVISQILELYGVQAAKMTLAKTEDDAAALAAEIGMPVVLKVASPDISHKTDVGGVLLNLADEKSVRGGFQTVIDAARSCLPDAIINGVYVQQMVPLGQEVILGAVQDPQFGPVVMFGSGGTEVEGLKDLSFGLAPLTELEIDNMLTKTWAGRKLNGYRNIPAADIPAVRDIMVRLAQLASDFPQFSEIEINPLRVFAKGAAAVDVRIVIK
jgi:acetyltransferase